MQLLTLQGIVREAVDKMDVFIALDHGIAADPLVFCHDRIMCIFQDAVRAAEHGERAI